MISKKEWYFPNSWQRWPYGAVKYNSNAACVNGQAMIGFFFSDWKGDEQVFEWTRKLHTSPAEEVEA